MVVNERVIKMLNFLNNKLDHNDFPIYEGYQNLNGCKNEHSRRIARLLLSGEILTSNGYNEKYFCSDFRKYVSDLIKYYGYDIENRYVTSVNNKRYKQYFILNKKGLKK